MDEGRGKKEAALFDSMPIRGCGSALVLVRFFTFRRARLAFCSYLAQVCYDGLPQEKTRNRIVL